MNIIDEIEKEQIKEISQKRNVPEFGPGDTLKIHLKVLEGNRERIQVFEGVCIARSNKGLNSSFTVRKISNGEGVERVFPLFSPIIDSIEVVRKGDVKRAKLYYLRDRTGKRARIADRDRGDEADQYELAEIVEEVVKAPVETPAEEAVLQEAPAEEPTEKAPAEAVAEEAPAEAEKQNVEEKSESSASEAEKTEDESKS